MKFIKLNAVFMSSEYYKELERISNVEDKLTREAMLRNIEENDYEVMTEVYINANQITSLNSSVKTKGRTVVRTPDYEYLIVGERDSIVEALEDNIG